MIFVKCFGMLHYCLNGFMVFVCFVFCCCFVLLLKLLYISLKQNLLLFSFTRKRYSDVKNKYNLVERRFHCYEDLGQTPEVFADISIRPQFCHLKGELLSGADVLVLIKQLK